MQTLKTEKTPNGVTPTSVLLDKNKAPNLQTGTGTLARLIENVRAREQKFGYVTETELLEIAHFYTINRWVATKDEKDQAIVLLAKYHMATLLCNRRKLEEAKQKPARARCARCGLVITSKKSLETGLGSVCRKKVTLADHAPEKPKPPSRDWIDDTTDLKPGPQSPCEKCKETNGEHCKTCLSFDDYRRRIIKEEKANRWAW